LGVNERLIDWDGLGRAAQQTEKCQQANGRDSERRGDDPDLHLQGKLSAANGIAAAAASPVRPVFRRSSFHMLS
jgi:hypothetical protein